MPRQGLTQDIIIQKSVQFINEQGYQKLSFAALSKLLDVKPPAMFKHFKNIDQLREYLTLVSIKMLKQKLQDAATGRAGEAALTSVCNAYRDFAKANRGLYQAMQPSYFGRNKEIEQAAIQLMSIIITVLKGFEIGEEHYIHLLRVIRSSLHGFVVLELEYGFGMTANIDISFEHQINAIIFMIKSLNA